MTNKLEPRMQTAAILRTVADLIEQHPELPLPRAEVAWHVMSGHAGADVPALLALVTSAVTGPWKPEVRSTSDWLYLTSTNRDSGIHGVTVSVGCPAADVGVKSAVRSRTEEIPVWELPASVAGVVGTSTVERS